MNRIKKITISIIIGLIVLLGFCTTANAYYYNIGQEIWVTFSDYWNNSDIYCAEHGQQPPNELGSCYRIVSQVRIEGNKSTDYTGITRESWYNAKLAYILSASNGGYPKGGSNAGPVSQAIWNYLYTWMLNVGQYHSGLYLGFAGTKQGYSTWLDTESTNYANNLRDTTKITDNTNKNNIKVVAYEKDGKSYMRVGPFNWSFPGTMANVTANDQNGNQISGVLYSSFNGNQESWFGASGIQSGKDFYISVPMDTEISKITKITGYTNVMVKGVNIWFAESALGYRQNLIIREPYEVPEEISTPFDYDILIQGNLKVIKVNANNEEIKLPGVGFYIEHKNTGKYVHQDADGKISYVEKADATEFITDGNGEILIKNLMVGTYIAYETKNPNYGYEMITEGKEHNVVVDKTEEFTIPNTQIYVKLSGYVWVDKISGKTSVRNDLYKDADYDANDILLDGITVRLKDKTTGETIKEAKTADGGAYLFEDVLIEKLDDYYIEFEYDGLTYTNVVPHIDKDNGSKSAESEEVRDEFNKNFSSVEGKTRDTGFTRDANGNEKHTLSYNINETGHEATLINNGQYTITANTDVANYIIRDHFTYGQEEIKYINLGLYEREQPDIALVKDLQNVRLTINGYEHTYTYAQRFVNAGEYSDELFNVGVRFGEKYGDLYGEPYYRPVYKSDYDYINETDKSKELKVYVTYQITMRNQSSNLTAQINSIADYYDSKYQIEKVGTSLDEKGNVVGEISHTEAFYNGNYTKTVINNSTRIEAQKEESVYVQFVLSREAVINILNDEENLDNVAEINSYSIFDKNGNIYAGIDKDSNPGNCVPGDTKTYEDDTDSSKALKLEATVTREMTGKVFLDESTGGVGKVREGDGEYSNNEEGISGVEVTLTETTGSGKVYTATTDANGDFTISDYIPGDYTLTYTWGDDTYTVQNYKGTIYKDKDRQYNVEWYKENVDTRLSDAIDNYETRKDIDSELEKVSDRTEITKTKMNSTTPMMGIGIEEETNGDTKYGITSIETETEGDKFIPKGFSIKNIDFGIVERARQVLDISKNVTGFKLTLANGQVIMDAKVVDGKLEGDTIKGLTYQGPANGNNGFVKAEIDNELIQGATLEVEYTINVENKSEQDYDSEEYYKYGTITGEVIKMKPTGVYDYLDSQMLLDKNKNNGWEVISTDKYEATYQFPTMIESYFNEGKTTEIKDDGTENSIYKWEISESSYQTLFTKWATMVEEQKTIREAKLDNKTILHNADLEKDLAPGKNNSVNLYTTKVLANTEEIDLNNDTEITEIQRIGQTGRIPDITTSYTYDRGETVIVTPPTGNDQNYILPIIIGATALIILAAGVVIIKKKAI